MSDALRGTDVDLLRKAIAKLTAEREHAARTRAHPPGTRPLMQPPTRQPAVAPSAAARPAEPEAPVDPVRKALLLLESLYNEGLVTIEEYQRKRVEILDRL